MRLLDRRLIDGEAERRESRHLHAHVLYESTWQMQTAAPVGSRIEEIARIVSVEDLTDAPDLRVLTLQDMLTADEWMPKREISPLVAGPSAEDPSEQVLEVATEAGAPTAALLLAALRELRTWMLLSQEQICQYLSISPSTVMAWKRERDIHPRHPQMSSLLRLWAAVAGAQEEFGEEGMQRLVGPHRTHDGHFMMPPAELATLLLDAADEAGMAALVSDEYDPEAPLRPSVAEIEAGERELSDSLTKYLEGLGDADDE